MSAAFRKRLQAVAGPREKENTEMSRGRGNNDGAATGLAVIFLIILLMPLVGIYLLTRQNEDDKAMGLILTVVGIIIWIILGVCQ